MTLFKHQDLQFKDTAPKPKTTPGSQVPSTSISKVNQAPGPLQTQVDCESDELRHPIFWKDSNNFLAHAATNVTAIQSTMTAELHNVSANIHMDFDLRAKNCFKKLLKLDQEGKKKSFKHIIPAAITLCHSPVYVMDKNVKLINLDLPWKVLTLPNVIKEDNQSNSFVRTDLHVTLAEELLVANEKYAETPQEILLLNWPYSNTTPSLTSGGDQNEVNDNDEEDMMNLEKTKGNMCWEVEVSIVKSGLGSSLQIKCHVECLFPTGENNASQENEEHINECEDDLNNENQEITEGSPCQEGDEGEVNNVESGKPGLDFSLKNKHHADGGCPTDETHTMCHELTHDYM
ncbi:hypothetical protein Clacol_004389 [Clathrus columnatus]|uniref:Uncharacterized protein n=1 Tax=Clathrus columnatus TaxID=1419009 RepID=A0AAV5AAF2_9AGAM|nr:hypothetical protein Clacol_004389 [Clathrus columnatus]